MIALKSSRAYNLSIRIMLVFLFAYAAIVKGITFHAFTIQLSESPLIPANLVYPVAIGVICIELVTCILLIIEKKAWLGLLLSYSLMLFFSLYILYILELAPSIPCACGGILGRLDHSYHLLFNVTITLLIMPALFMDKLAGPAKMANAAG